MQLRNSTKDIVIAHHVQIADSFWRRLKGLLGTKVLPAGSGLIIKPCNSVHTFGMAYPIDVLFVDGSHCIIKIVKNMLPGKIKMMLGSCYVVELQAGTAEQIACTVGDQLELQ